MESTAVELPRLQRKLDLLCAYLGINRAALAVKLGREKSTLTGWVNGTAKSKPEFVAEPGRQLLAQVLAEKLGCTPLHARQLWLGPAGAFAEALDLNDESELVEVIAEAPRRSMVRYLKGGGTQMNVVNWDEARDDLPDAIKARLGERFALAIAGSPGEQVLLLVESVSGCHLGAPQGNLRLEIPETGVLRLPAGVKTFGFDPPGGRHRFLVFAHRATTWLKVTSHGDSPLPLSTAQLQTLASQLSDSRQVPEWVLDVLQVEVS